MPLPWLKALNAVSPATITELITGGLSYGIYANLATTFINKNVGWSHASGILRNTVPGFNSRVFADIYWNQYQTIDQRNIIKNTSAYDVIPTDNYIERPLSEPVKYRYIGEFTYLDDLSGERKKEYKSYYSNQRLSIADAGQLLYDSHNMDLYPTWRQLESVRLSNVEHNELWDY